MENILHFDLILFLKTAGYLGMFLVVFSESGLLIGFFLPGDSLLFTAGFLASQGFFELIPLILITLVAAITGDSVGYTFGKTVGPKIFTREDSLFFHKDHLERARIFYEHHGGKAIIFARFLPLVRTFAPILAGVGNMKYSTFLFYNIAGGILWTLLLTLFGYYLGKTIPDVDTYLLPIVGSIIAISLIPSIVHIVRYTFLKKK
ncbi:MAG: VTT domain-containing protein [bacterium]|nr:VTT domain-containing protein [bacterium]